MKHPLLLFLLVMGLITMECAEAMDVPPAYRRVAAEYGIPAQVLYAVALTESGLRMPLSGDHRPWPWTLNVAGKAYRYGSRDLAYAALTRHLAQTDMVDVGLMQVNWRYHSNKLLDQRLSLDPWFNLRVGASILRSLYDECGDWMVAAGRYHAPENPERAAGYMAKVRLHMASVDGVARVH
jgi:soluble lytic murein transglycosylase-like protein